MSRGEADRSWATAGGRLGAVGGSAGRARGSPSVGGSSCAAGTAVYKRREGRRRVSAAQELAGSVQSAVRPRGEGIFGRRARCSQPALRPVSRAIHWATSRSLDLQDVPGDGCPEEVSTEECERFDLDHGSLDGFEGIAVSAAKRR